MTSAFNLKFHLKEYFEGLGQVLFCKDAYFGAALLFLSCFFEPSLFVFGFISSAIGYAYSTRYRTPKTLKAMGLLTINGYFFGLSLASLFEKSLPFYVCFLVGALAIPLVTKAVFEILQHWKLNPLIAPYIFTVWVLYLCGSGIALQPNDTPYIESSSLVLQYLHLNGLYLKMLSSLFFGMSQIFFLQNFDFGFCLLCLITAFNWRNGSFFFLGTALSTVIFYILSNGSYTWQYGFFGFSAGLVGLALASMPEKFNVRTILLFCVLSLFLTLAIDRLLKGFGLPMLSMPYVVTFWFALLSRVPRLNVSWAPAEIS